MFFSFSFDDDVAQLTYKDFTKKILSESVIHLQVLETQYSF